MPSKQRWYSAVITRSDGTWAYIELIASSKLKAQQAIRRLIDNDSSFHSLKPL